MLRLFALFTAFLVVSVRFSSSFPVIAACASLPDAAANQACPVGDQPREEDTLAPVSADDSDDAADAIIAPAAPRIRLLTNSAASGVDCGALAADRALSSHARGLERPPRV